MYTHSKQLTENLLDLENKMRLTKRQLKRITKEERTKLMQEGHVELDADRIFDEIGDKMEHDLLSGIQGKIQQAYNDPSGDGVDLGALAEDMGFTDLMEQVAAWFEEYIAECESRYL